MREQINSGNSFDEQVTHALPPAARLLFRSYSRLAQDPTTSKEAEKDPVTNAQCQAILNLPPDYLIIQQMTELATIQLKDVGSLAVGQHVDYDVGSPVNAPGKRFSRKKNDEVNSTTSELIGTLRSANNLFFNEYIPDFYEREQSLTTAEAWRPFFEILEFALRNNPDDPRVEERNSNLYGRKVSTNPPYRNLSLELLFQSLTELYPEGIFAADVGSSVASGYIWQYRKLEGNPKIPQMQLDKVREFGARSLLTDDANRLVQLPTPIKEVVAIDIQDVYYPHRNMYNPAFIKWAFHCMRAAERHNKPLMEMLEELVGSKPDEIKFFLGDITDPSIKEEYKKQHPEPRNVINMSASVHQNSPETRRKMFETAEELLSDNGVLIASEFAFLGNASYKKSPPQTIGPQPISSLRMRDFWHRAGYFRTFAAFKQHPKGFGWQEVTQHLNSRGTSLTVMPNTIPMPSDGLVSLADLIRGASKRASAAKSE